MRRGVDSVDAPPSSSTRAANSATSRSSSFAAAAQRLGPVLILAASARPPHLGRGRHLCPGPERHRPASVAGVAGVLTSRGDHAACTLPTPQPERRAEHGAALVAVLSSTITVLSAVVALICRASAMKAIASVLAVDAGGAMWLARHRSSPEAPVRPSCSCPTASGVRRLRPVRAVIANRGVIEHRAGHRRVRQRCTRQDLDVFVAATAIASRQFRDRVPLGLCFPLSSASFVSVPSLDARDPERRRTVDPCAWVTRSAFGC